MMLIFEQKIFSNFALIIILSAFPLSAQAGAREIASRMFQRLAGYSLPLDDSHRVTMETAITKGLSTSGTVNDFVTAAKVATADPNFINLTVRQWAMPMSNLSENSREQLNDFVATIMGATRDNLDARTLLTDNMVYVVDIDNPDLKALKDANQLAVWNPISHLNHFLYVDKTRIDVQKYLIKKTQEAVSVSGAVLSSYELGSSAAAGLLTTHSWASAHLNGGTNRRAIAYALKEFLCTSIESVADTSVPDDRVRRDVDRMPGGEGTTYQKTCRGCHAGMDALAGAYAHFNYGNYLIYSPKTVQSKMNQNNTVYPNGYVTKNDSWINKWNANLELGWSTQVAESGSGVNSLGEMLANSDAFSMCMVRRTFRTVCGLYGGADDPPGPPPSAALTNVFNSLKIDFENNNYNLKRLFEQTAAHGSCLGK